MKSHMCVSIYNGEPVVLLHYVVLIGNHGVVRLHIVTRWHYGLLVTQRLL